MQLTEKQNLVLQSQNHLLVTGGPGSGKTTVAIYKAEQLLSEELKSYQKVLFLSFARASVSRVLEAIESENNLDKEIKKRIDVDTYHSFFWSILKTHGYLIELPKKLEVLTPHRKAIVLSGIQDAFPSPLSDAQRQEKERAEEAEIERVRYENGFIDFDYFAIGVFLILARSAKIRALIANKYPVIIFDEFQDTNNAQWQAFEALGMTSKMIALADPEQRIYDWIGASPERLDHFRTEFSPDEIDFAQNNHRSKNSEIALFANDMFKGKFEKDSYDGIVTETYNPFKGQAYAKLVSTILQSIRRVKRKRPKGWSIGVLVPTKRMTREISEILAAPPAGLPRITHEPYIEVEAAMLAAELIAFCLQPQNEDNGFDKFISLMIHYLQGRGGDKPTRRDLSQATSFTKAKAEFERRKLVNKGMRSNSIIAKAFQSYQEIKALSFSGSPEEDWRLVASIIQASDCERLKMLADDARNIRLLQRGEQIRLDMASDWRNFGSYMNALTLVREAFVQQHFANKSKIEAGVLLMNMHKAKGKQFDETIIFESWPVIVKGKVVANNGRIVRFNDIANVDDQNTQNFRVSITRSITKTTILTPSNDPCILLFDRQP